jgi:hypothetical protein
MKPFTLPLVAAAVFLVPGWSSADVLLMDAINQNPVNSAEGVLRPTNGESMDKVRQRFGDPVREMPWVGDPPITRWVYDNFTVYFEHDLVITSVVHR